LAGSINSDFALTDIGAQQQFDCFPGSFTYVVGNTRTETNFDQPIEITSCELCNLQICSLINIRHWRDTRETDQKA